MYTCILCLVYNLLTIQNIHVVCEWPTSREKRLTLLCICLLIGGVLGLLSNLISLRARV